MAGKNEFSVAFHLPITINLAFWRYPCREIHTTWAWGSSHIHRYVIQNKFTTSQAIILRWVSQKFPWGDQKDAAVIPLAELKLIYLTTFHHWIENVFTSVPTAPSTCMLSCQDPKRGMFFRFFLLYKRAWHTQEHTIPKPIWATGRRISHLPFLESS